MASRYPFSSYFVQDLGYDCRSGSKFHAPFINDATLLNTEFYFLSVHIYLILKFKHIWGVRVAQSVKCLTLDFGLGHDFRVLGSNPRSGTMHSGESA